jgi:hypothetical protein
LLDQAGNKANGGQEIHLADIEADEGAGMGIFEQLHLEDSPAALAKASNERASANHGRVDASGCGASSQTEIGSLRCVISWGKWFLREHRASWNA